MPLYKYLDKSQIRHNCVDIAFTSQDKPIQILLLKKSQIDWEKSKGFKYCHLGAIRFGLNALVWPFMNINSMCVVVDTHHNQLSDAIIGGFSSPLHDGLAFGTVYPKYSVSLDDPYIYKFLQAYIQSQGFDMSVNSLIPQLKTLIIVQFGNDSLPPLDRKSVV